MPLTVKYDDESDILTVWTGEDVATSSSATKYRGLIVDFGNEDGFDVVGFELAGAAKLLSPFLGMMLQRSAANQGSCSGGYSCPSS